MNLSKPQSAPDALHWWKTDNADIAAMWSTLRHPERGRTLSQSAGGRDVLEYSTRADMTLQKSTANFNSACGARNLDAFFPRGPQKRKRPHILVLGGVHGTETEGVAGALSLLRFLDAGVALDDSRPDWSADFSEIDWTVCPLLNPDGRARMEHQGFVGWQSEAMQAINCGVDEKGQAYGWPRCKEVHPMPQSGGRLGGYFDDAGANMMHDEWFAPMNKATTALLKVIAQTAPDLVLNLHSSDLETCFFLKTWYVPLPVKKALLGLAQNVYADLECAGYALGPLPFPAVEGDNSWPPLPAFNLDSMMFHAGAALPATFESPRGLIRGESQFDYAQLLDVHHRLFRVCADTVLQWYRGEIPYPLNDEK